MIKVELATTHDWAQALYERYKDSEVIRLVIQKDGLTLDYEMSVSDAEELAKKLIEWAHEVKPYVVKER